MQTVIKGTKTIEEYKRVKATMEELAEDEQGSSERL